MISVIIPIYNNIRHLKDCLDSVSAQTDLESLREQGAPRFRGDSAEIIIVDDGSAAETAKKIDEIGSGFKIIHIPHTGAAGARNRGFAASNGELVFFCDADIELNPSCLGKMMKALAENSGVSYAYSDYQLGWKKMRACPFDAEKLKKFNYISTMSLIRRADFPGFDESLKRFQDWDLWLTLLERGKTGVYIPEALFCAHPAKLGISKWRPGFFYKFFPWAKSAKEYNEARGVVLKKHKLL